MATKNIDFNNLTDIQKNIILGKLQRYDEESKEEAEVEKIFSVFRGDYIEEIYKVGERIHIAKVRTTQSNSKDRIYLYHIVIDKKERISSVWHSFDVALLGALTHIHLGLNNTQVTAFMAAGLAIKDEYEKVENEIHQGDSFRRYSISQIDPPILSYHP